MLFRSLAAADAVVADFERQGVPLAQATWGRRNTAKILHPFGRLLPTWIAGFLGLRDAASAYSGTASPRSRPPSFTVFRSVSIASLRPRFAFAT